MADRYPLPDDTRQALADYRRCSNPSLAFDRLLLDLRGAPAGAKAAELRRVRDCPLDEPLLEAFRGRWRRAALAAGATLFEAATDWRLIVGLGRKGPLEAGFAFHRLYGFPILPGSGLKGLARAWALLGEGRDPLDPDVVAVFGRGPLETPSPRGEGRGEREGRAGGAVFFDAIPAALPRLELDVMNPHFPDYYQRDKPPANWQSPVPIPFLAVAPGTTFLFAVGTRGGAGPEVRARAVEWLRGGLRDLGAGAKTAAGYGFFVPGPVEPEEPPAAGARAAAPAAAEAAPPLEWLRGTVRWWHSGKGQGELSDDETGQRLPFDRGTLEDRSWTPGSKRPVEYAVERREAGPVVVRVRRTIPTA